jgi:hypothetical protein
MDSVAAGLAEAEPRQPELKSLGGRWDMRANKVCKVLADLDIRAEAEDLGVSFSASAPNSEGWLACHAVGRDDKHPSAAINVGSGPLRGRYRDLGDSSGKSRSFFALAVMAGAFATWKDAVRHYASKVTANPRPICNPREPRQERPIFDQILFLPTGKNDDELRERFSTNKPGISPDALKAFRAIKCRWPGWGKANKRHLCWGLVGRRPGQARAIALTLFRADGKEFPAAGNLSERKTHLVRGSSDSWLWPGDEDALSRARVVIKVEGPTDAMALWSLLPADWIVVTNLAGAAANPDRLGTNFACKKLVIVIGDADEPGQAGARRFAQAFARHAGQVLLVRLPYDTTPSHGRDMRDWLVEGHGRSDLKALIDGAERIECKASAFTSAVDGAGGAHEGGSAGPRKGLSARPTVMISTQEDDVNAAAAQALATDLTIYQRGGQLVRVVTDRSPAPQQGIRRTFSARIEPLPRAVVRERLAANAQFVMPRVTADGYAEVPAHPPAWCVAAVYDRAEWPCVRHLECILDFPVLRPDGTLLTTPGFDPSTGLLLLPTNEVPITTSAAPTQQDAEAARDELLEVVADFPFARETHKAAWLASLLTPLARFAFRGPAPLFLIDANTRGSGKGLLAHCVSQIITGEHFTVASFTNDQEELRKRITSLAMAGDRTVLLDNLDAKFGNAVFDAALTATSWKDRVLGGNRIVEAPLYVTWFATGNNVSIATDTARRTCHIRLESPMERPEECLDFRYPDLHAWVAHNRPRLLSAALTVMLAYQRAGRPNMKLRPWGSYEGWSAFVRSAVVWVGLPDPGATRLMLEDATDIAVGSMGLILEAWERMDPQRQGLTAADVIERLKHPVNPPDWYAGMRASIEELAGRLDSTALGRTLRKYRKRVFAGRYINRAGERHRAAKWIVYPASALRKDQDVTLSDSSDSSARPSQETSQTSQNESSEGGRAPLPESPLSAHRRPVEATRPDSSRSSALIIDYTTKENRGDLPPIPTNLPPSPDREVFYL